MRARLCICSTTILTANCHVAAIIGARYCHGYQKRKRLCASELRLTLESRARQESRDAVITSDVQASVGKEPSTVDIVHPVIKQTQVKTAE
ncbi:uncharacterized protein K489DRAFT_178201 [Dissoconium aciculare CBS 342.82]|uniref:Uncharacterized protein n=1 Tax=Dissoconium aciculare CBS 342.82 TaxID=1314786 RepID=A0A6J3MBP4_9PEZI|nr:uncharacterized protein K489DRAFT_178201 [Dissoconium aciculare CBS 342.82]KAF1824257.1 hypothetical protein K489DRAFT_178201 [Dissoconium aciculare CBS 342.82]